MTESQLIAFMAGGLVSLVVAVAGIWNWMNCVYILLQKIEMNTRR